MSEQHINTPTITAETLGITPVTLRRWCDYHSAHLSQGANPLAGQARRFSGRDLEVLKTVKQLRDQGFTVANINDQLGKLTFAEIDTTAQQDETAIEAHPAVPEGLQQAPAPIVAQDYILSIEHRLERLERSKEPSFISGLALGFIGACLMFLLLIGLALLYAQH